MSSVETWAPDSGDTAWHLATSALMLMMTVPGLALYYGGMAGHTNLQVVTLQIVTVASVITFLWLCVGYSLSFAPIDQTKDHFVIGDYSRMWLLGMDLYSYNQIAPTVPEAAFCIRQLTFAIVSGALIMGAFSFRIKYWSMIVFTFMWHVFVYCPIAHVVWHPAGFLYKLGTIDGSGGLVIHLASGLANVCCSIFVGHKNFHTEKFEPSNILQTFTGACLLWVGFFGFNSGSCKGAGAQASFAMLNTQICSACCAITSMLSEAHHLEFPTILGMLSGAISGLIVISPGAGYVDPTGAFVMGTVAGPICYYAMRIHHIFGFEDAFDVFSMHAVGGALGTLMVGLFARYGIGGVDGAFYGYLNGAQFGYQLAGVAVIGAYTVFMTVLILFLISKTIGLLLPENEHANDLDSSIHGGEDGGGSKNGKSTVQMSVPDF